MPCPPPLRAPGADEPTPNTLSVHRSVYSTGGCGVSSGRWRAGPDSLLTERVVKLLVVERAHQVRVTGRSVNTSRTRVKKDQGSEVKGHGSRIKDHGSMVLVKDRGSRIKGQGSRVMGQVSVLRVIGHWSRVVGQTSRVKGQVSGLRLVRMVTSARGPCDRVICQHMTYEGQGSNEKSQGSWVKGQG